MASPKAIATATTVPAAAGAFKFADGTPVANGYIKLTLSTVCSVSGGDEIVPKVDIIILLDANGVPSKMHDGYGLSTFTTAPAAFGNDQLTPSGTVYQMRLYASNGSLLLADFGSVSLSGSAPIDLTTIVSTSSSVSYPSPSPSSVAVAYSATPTFTVPNGIQSNILFTITLTGNVTSSTFAGALAGQIIIFKIIQDGTGGRTFTYPTNVKGGQAPDPGASAISSQAFYFDGSNAISLSDQTVN